MRSDDAVEKDVDSLWEKLEDMRNKQIELQLKYEADVRKQQIFEKSLRLGINLISTQMTMNMLTALGGKNEK